MKKLIFSILLLAMIFSAQAQANRTDILQDLEQNQIADQDVTTTTATTTAATRLFADKYDLTSVILIIPSGSKVEVLGSEENYLYVIFEEYEGFIRSRHAAIDKAPVETGQAIQEQEEQPVQQQEQEVSRFTYLQNKYGTNVAAKLNEGKIWKGMTAEMVNDSWGTPQKINRVISGNNIREEWIYTNTWLFFQNDRLREWGPIRR
jgi:hypothetical protein